MHKGTWLVPRKHSLKKKKKCNSEDGAQWVEYTPSIPNALISSRTLHTVCTVWWHIPVIPAFKCRQQDQKFKVIPVT